MKTTFPRVNFIHEWKRFLYGLGIFVNICKWKCILMCDCIFVDKGLAEWQCLLYQACLERNRILLVFQRKILREHVINWHKIYIYFLHISWGIIFPQVSDWTVEREFWIRNEIGGEKYTEIFINFTNRDHSVFCWKASRGWTEQSQWPSILVILPKRWAQPLTPRQWSLPTSS